MSNSNSQSSPLHTIIEVVSVSAKKISEEDSQQLPKGIYDRCQELNLPTVVDSCIGVNDEDAQPLLQRILFDLDHPFVQNCPTCYELERASQEGFKFNAPGCRISTVGRNESFFKFHRRDGLIGHHSPSQKTNDGWMSIEYFGIATATSFPIGHSARSYTARKVSSKTPDYSLLSKWLNHCSIYHEACEPCSSAELATIYLIDVKKRSLVRYPSRPSQPVDYLALSYVWGATPPESFTLCPLPDELPASIEDAIQVTRNLQKQYLWVDYVCIDQQDPKQQSTQIELMDDIYSAAFATIISLEGLNAGEGLPRVGSDSRVVPHAVVDFERGNSLVSVMPPLRIKLRESN